MITVDKETTGEQKGRIADDLREKWGFREEFLWTARNA